MNDLVQPTFGLDGAREYTMDELAPKGRERAGAAPLVDRAALAATGAARRGADLDADDCFPVEDIRQLHADGLLIAPFPAGMGGETIGIGDPHCLRRVLTAIGRGNLALGRLYEGHVNAVTLVARYGTEANLALLRQDADNGLPSGVWMAGEALRLDAEGDRAVLRGRKILCSGAGYFRRPLVAADRADGSVMVIPLLDRADRSDASGWTPHGMRATATGDVDFDGLTVERDEIVGGPGDYLRSPYFRGGAWRVLAVQLGGVEAVLDAYRTQLAESPNAHHPIQLARFGEAEIACETARLWVKQAATVAEGPFENAEAVDAYVDLARNAFEAAALRVMAHAQKAIGLKAYLRPNPIERLIRDLSTYLRQPALDVSLMSAAAFRLRTTSETT